MLNTSFEEDIGFYTEAAYKCGSNDSNYFATVFKRIIGVSLEKYRLMQNKNEK